MLAGSDVSWLRGVNIETGGGGGGRGGNVSENDILQLNACENKISHAIYIVKDYSLSFFVLEIF